MSVNASGPAVRSTKLRARQLQSGMKGDLIAIIGEGVGTTLFLLMAFLAAEQSHTPGTISVNGSDTMINDIGGANQQRVFYASLGFGISLLVNVFIFARISGAHLNPAVTLAFIIIGAIPPLRAVGYIIAQILGGIVAAGFAEALLPGTLNVVTTLTPGVSISQGLFIEMFATSQLVLAILFLALEKNDANSIAPMVIGFALFVGELASIGWTGGSINPARSFGPAVVKKSFVGYHWIYWVGPFLGAALAALFYVGAKWAPYESAGNAGSTPPEALAPPNFSVGEAVSKKPADYHGTEEEQTEDVLKNVNGNPTMPNPGPERMV